MSIEKVKTLLRNTKSSDEWNNVCDLVKEKYDGLYPDWWYAEIVLSGLAQIKMVEFK